MATRTALKALFADGQVADGVDFESLIDSLAHVEEDGLLPPGWIHGLTLSNNVTDADHDIDIAVGKARDEGDNYDLALAAGLTKQIDAAWAVGTNAGGLFTGSSPAADTWYHVFLIRKDSDGTIDAGFDTSITAANIPAGYTAYRRIGSVLHETTAIRQFFQSGDLFSWEEAVTELNTSTPPTSWSALAITTPLDVSVSALVSGTMYNGSVADTILCFWHGLGTAPSSLTLGIMPIRYLGTGTKADVANPYPLITDTSQQVRYACTSGSSTVTVYSMGYYDARGKT